MTDPLFMDEDGNPVILNVPRVAAFLRQHINSADRQIGKDAETAARQGTTRLRMRAWLHQAGEDRVAVSISSYDDIEQMTAIVKEGLLAGALGFSSSRTIGHKALDGEPVPGTFAKEDELFGIGSALKETGLGIFELAPAGAAGDSAGDGADAILEELDWMCRLSREIERPVSFAMFADASQSATAKYTAQ